MRAIGLNQRAARYAGFKIKGQIIGVMLLSGALAALAGLAEVSGIHFRLQQGLAVGYGYDGIIVAWLARLTPLAVPLVALLLGTLIVGGEQLQAVLLFGLLLSEALARYGCTFVGGLGAGLAGAYLSLSYTPGWKESMTGGQGWVAIALVIFATWNPLRAVIGAFLFGGLTALQFYFQAVGIELIPAYILKMLPYVLTIVVMVAVNAGMGRRRFSGPAALGVPFNREG